MGAVTCRTPGRAKPDTPGWGDVVRIGDNALCMLVVDLDPDTGKALCAWRVIGPTYGEAWLTVRVLTVVRRAYAPP